MQIRSMKSGEAMHAKSVGEPHLVAKYGEVVQSSDHRFPGSRVGVLTRCKHVILGTMMERVVQAMMMSRL